MVNGKSVGLGIVSVYMQIYNLMRTVRILLNHEVRAYPFLLFVSLGLVHSPAFAQCDAVTEQAENADGSSLQLVVQYCDEAIERDIRVSYRATADESYTQLFHLVQDAEEAPMGGAALRDLDGDGLHELETRGMCGAGPNCEGAIYRLTSERDALFEFFASGYADLIMVDEFLVESGRASCCSWEYHVYLPRSNSEPVQASDFVYAMAVGIDVGSDTDNDVTCTFTDSQNQVVVPSNPNLLALCSHYGPDYILATPESTTL